MNKLSSNSYGSNRSKLNTLINSLGRVEKYDATQVHCCSFAKASDIADGIKVRCFNCTIMELKYDSGCNTECEGHVLIVPSWN